MAEHIVDLTEDLGASMVATCVPLLVLSWIAIGLRTYTRLILTKSFQLDDLLMLVAQLIFTHTCVMVLKGVNKGMGKHNDAVTNEDDRVAALMWQVLATVVYILDMMFIKLSIGMSLLRLAVRKIYRYSVMVSLVLIVLWSLGILLWDVFQCNPVPKQWDFRINDGHCASANEMISAAYALSVLAVLSDWLYALLPIPMLWNAKMTKQAKATVIFILGLGILASIATLIRLKYLNRLQDADDLLFTATDAMIWTLVEPGVAIIASGLATIRPLLRAIKVSGFTSPDKVPITGISGSFQYEQNSRNTTTLGSMPGFGPGDVSLREVGGRIAQFDCASRLIVTVNATAPGGQFDYAGRLIVTAIMNANVAYSTNGGSGGGMTNSCGPPRIDWPPNLHPTNRALEDCHALEGQSQGLSISSGTR
ncbi:integral membrane family protein [Purpureocillium lavendulum]|uniref:Integral membrane family protein n=1 Tax=Purpureocillium lavendulum TaxID=1247861 RepID=A0AB34FGL0_9HYPO|nr:integral membrane family protein [Purpureocillium lavendulum]